MKSLQGLGFEISRTHTGEFKVSKDPVVTTADMATAEGTLAENPGQLKPGGRGRGTAAPKEDQQRFEGEPQHKLPSKVGGIAGGHPASGHGTSLSRKNFPDGITPANFEAVKRTLQTSVDFGWTKQKTESELRSKAFMTVRQARQIVKDELGQTRRWEDDEEK